MVKNQKSLANKMFTGLSSKFVTLTRKSKAFEERSLAQKGQ
jgi:hypothetical protein